MKRLLTFVVLVFWMGNALALGFHFGVHGGKDFYSISSMDKGFQLADLTEARVEREGFSNPWLAGVDLQWDLLMGLKLEATAEAAYHSYNVVYTRNDPQPGDPFHKLVSEYDVKFARAGLVGSLKMNILPLPIVDLYFGGGAGIHWIAPLVSDKFLMGTLMDKAAELDPSEDVKVESRLGGHLLVGASIHPPMFPLKFALEAKYNFLQSGEYEEPDKFATVVLKIFF